MVGWILFPGLVIVSLWINYSSEDNKSGTFPLLDLSEESELGTDIDGSVMKILIFDGIQFRTALSKESAHWEDAKVPYEISSEYSDEDKQKILDAIEEFRNKTCVDFYERKNETAYISIIPGSGCSAGLGKFPKVNNVSIGKNCLVKGIVLHELMHSLSFVHEQNRPDRDEYVTIVWDNIAEDHKANFKKYEENEVRTFNQSYDYSSVMHYGEFDFAINKSNPTIIPKKKGVEIGQRKDFSEKDLIKINMLYNCDAKNDEQVTTKSADITKGDDEVTTKSVAKESPAEEDKKKRKTDKRKERFSKLIKLLS